VPWEVGLARRLWGTTRMRKAKACGREFDLDGVSINIMSMGDAVSSITAALHQRDGFVVCTLNLDHFVKLRSEPAFRAAYKRARFVSADGFPIVLAGRLAGVPITRTTGADLVEPLCGEASRKRLPVYLFGSTGKTLARSVRRLSGRFDGLRVVGARAPSRNFEPHSAEADRAIEEIERSGARICFVALGAPKQEIFSARCLDRLSSTCFVCVGAALDYVAGTQSRAPAVAQKMGLEWLWRMTTNPRRLGPRYARCAAALPRLVGQALPQIIANRTGPPA
jgi:N-acetylglucosaminyldiphosphoundecaprenol N-acetyl-beta-D-mannosaminyltransferase